MWGETVTVADNQAGKLTELRRTHQRVRANVKLAVEWKQGSEASLHPHLYSGRQPLRLPGRPRSDLAVRQQVRLINRHGRGFEVAEARLVWRNPTTSSAGFKLEPRRNFLESLNA